MANSGKLARNAGQRSQAGIMQTEKKKEKAAPKPLGFVSFLFFCFMLVWPLLVIVPFAFPLYSCLLEIFDVAASQLDHGQFDAALVPPLVFFVLTFTVVVTFLFYYKRLVRNFFQPHLIRY
jgi:uncharacterized membrane protein